MRKIAAVFLFHFPSNVATADKLPTKVIYILTVKLCLHPPAGLDPVLGAAAFFSELVVDL